MHLMLTYFLILFHLISLSEPGICSVGNTEKEIQQKAAAGMCCGNIVFFKVLYVNNIFTLLGYFVSVGNNSVL